MSQVVSPTSPSLPAPKPIRFVNNEGQPPTKRRRINSACRTCRRRKTRCDGKRPLCSTCQDNGHECRGYGAERDDKQDIKNNDDYDEDVKTSELRRGEAGSRGMGNGLPQTRRTSTQYTEYTGDIPRAQREPRGLKTEASTYCRNFNDTAVFSDEEPSPIARPVPVHTDSHRVPYFRYFGPTAIVPGFKQMVVSVREHRRSTGAGSSIPVSPGSAGYAGGSAYSGTPSQTGTESRGTVEMPVYDQSDPLPVHRLIIHLVETFFAHIGCNYPFLRQKTFIQRVEERSVEAILVDAVCGLAARFSDHPLLTASRDSSYPKSEYGHVYAQRAKAAVVETFPCPTVAAVQACLLLAYEGFGANQDSALWMYLGCAIRMAVDLGLQKLDGVKHQGPKDPGYQRVGSGSDPSDPALAISPEEKMEIEQERLGTLWAVFMLDRVISSGTGRPVTLRNDDFELSFPAITDNANGDWPNPFPALIQIINLYGRVSDLLNNIRVVQDVTHQKIEGLAAMENDLTQLYQKLDSKLNFNAANFQHYCKTGEGTNFILVHFWFHTLIMLLHQPTLMHSFEGQIISLLPNSRELSMSSAKTIADILAFAELIDPRSFIGNPFTSQPMYIAACAFLMESAAHTSSQPTSRDTSPPPNGAKDTTKKERKNTHEQKQKHSLLASAANQNYQRCYKALQQLETYWAGTRYILVALDQKAKGIWDPETYTEQEYEATKIKQDMIPNWRRKLSLAGPSTPISRLGSLGSFARSPRIEAGIGSPNIDPGQAIGWSLTGTTNSPNSNLTFMYQNNMSGDNYQQPPAPPGAGNMIYDPIRSSIPETSMSSTSTSNYQSRYHQQQQLQPVSQPMPPPAPKYTTMADSATTSDAEMLLGLQNSPFAQTPGSHHAYDHSQSMASPQSSRHDGSSSFDFASNTSVFPGGPNGYVGLGGDMTMESQEINMSTLGGDMMPWYLPPEMLNFFDNGSDPNMAPGVSLNGSAELQGG